MVSGRLVRRAVRSARRVEKRRDLAAVAEIQHEARDE